MRGCLGGKGKKGKEVRKRNVLRLGCTMARKKDHSFTVLTVERTGNSVTAIEFQLIHVRRKLQLRNVTCGEGKEMEERGRRDN